MDKSIHNTEQTPQEFGSRVRSAVVWRSGTQILSQLVSWGATLAVIRILEPSDFGLYAMVAVVLAFLNFLNGYGFASSIIQAEKVDPIRIRQAFGMLLLLNFGLALTQLFVMAPLASYYFQEPQLASLLRWQSLIYLATPFIVLPEALMTRNLEFKKPAIVNLLSAFVGAAASLYMAMNGWGVWTLVFAPVAIFWTRAVSLIIATRFFVMPSFNFKGAGSMFSFGTLMMLSHGFWIIQSQSDIFIAGRSFNNHDLGLYAEALFLTLIFAAKFVPPLNEVAFPAYARLQNDKQALSDGFLKAVRLIMLISCPFYFGMAVTAYPLVETLMGAKWLGAAPLVAILSLAMPLMTLQILFHPALNALGLPHITMRNSMIGALVMPVIYLFAVGYGMEGLAWGWLAAFSLLVSFTFLQARKPIGITLAGLFASIWPGLLASTIMAAILLALERFVIMPMDQPLAAPLHLAILVATGGISYAAMLWFFARDTFLEALRLVFKRKPPEQEPAAA
jgi:O-antigen/teichoic acid export membrane protein